MSERAEVIVVGAGIAGASLAAELAAHCSVVVLEAEDQPGYHATGRSAAQFIRSYGPPDVRALAAAGRRFFAEPPAGFAEHPLTSPRGMLVMAGPGQEASLDEALASGIGLERIPVEAAVDKVPVLRREAFAGAAYEAESRDIDVAALHQGFLKLLRARGGRVATDARVRAMARTAEGWSLETRRGRFAAEVVVDAAGAWADEVAALAGIAPLGLTPKRRTALLVEAPMDCDIAGWPLVIDVDERWYFKPEPGGKLLVSPADETPSPPTDAQPEEIDVALAVDRFQAATTVRVRRIEHRWAGLRTFSPDGSLVIGREPTAPAFFWLAGQGGYGIQTAPGAARAAAGLLLDGALPEDVAAAGLEPAWVDPARFR